MAKKNCNIYGPDLSEVESQGKAIADEGMKIMRDVGATGRAAESSGSDVSKSELEKFKPSNP